MTGIEVYTITAADLLVVFGCALLLMVAAMVATLWAARRPALREQPEPAGLDVVEAAMVRSRRRRHHVPAHPRHPVYAPGRARVHEGPTFDLTEARRAVRR